MLEQQGGIKMVHVPYKGTGPALQDLLGGQVDLTFGTARRPHAPCPAASCACWP
jgi:tripartite-type tricarboxylate transporter receptor subunit TctC